MVDKLVKANDLITARSGTGVGTTDNCWLVGGSPVGNTEEWNGTNWSEVTTNDNMLTPLVFKVLEVGVEL